MKRKKQDYKKESMSPELAKKLNERKDNSLEEKKRQDAKFRKFWKNYVEKSKPVEPELTKLSDAETSKRMLAHKIFHMDEPQPETGIDLWGQPEQPHKKPKESTDNVLNETDSERVIEQLRTAKQKRTYSNEDIDYSNEELPPEESE